VDWSSTQMPSTGKSRKEVGSSQEMERFECIPVYR
jgi:hypothetical protein